MKRSWQCHPATSVICMWILSLFASDVCAAEDSMEASIGSRLEYTDNVFFSSQNVISATSIVAIPAVKLSHDSETLDSFVKLRIKSYQYSDDRLNNNDFYIDSKTDYAGERNLLSGIIRYESRSNLDLDSFNAGLSEEQNTKKTFTITPQYSYMLSERSLATIAYTFNDVSYDVGQADFVPYDIGSFSLTYKYNISPLTSANLVLKDTNYESDNGLSEYDLKLYQLGMVHKFDVHNTLVMSVGQSDRDTVSSGAPFDLFGVTVTPLGIRSSSQGLVYNLSWTSILTEAQTVTTLLSRSNIADSFGGLNEVDTARLLYKYKGDRRWHWDVIAKIEDVTALTSGLAFTNRTTLSMTLMSRYAITRSLDALASYKYVVRDFGNLLGSRNIDSNTIYVGLDYKFNRLEF